jgi:predicted transcriptional regulator|tara:strand:- start:475 stop:1002 length:528 start_codon:yes stop_codon:yes gene_type:complete
MALMVIERVLHGKSNPKIAEQFGVSVNTVSRYMKTAEEVGMFDELNDQLKDVTALALNVVKKKLERELNSENPNVKEAFKVLKGTHTLLGQNRPPPLGPGEVERSLTGYIRERQDNVQERPTGPQLLVTSNNSVAGEVSSDHNIGETENRRGDHGLRTTSDILAQATRPADGTKQ